MPSSSSSNNKNAGDEKDDLFAKDAIRPSMNLRMIRHAESRNNQVYSNARYIYRGGTPDFDAEGWEAYVSTHRKADPGLSDVGSLQADVLADYMVPHLQMQASHPVRIITSPMRRTLETILPTLERLQKEEGTQPKVHIIVNGFYHESEGCHIKEIPEEGMNPVEIREFLKDGISSPDDIEFVGFPQPDRGWYVNGQGPETRAHSEMRATKFFLWLCGYLDGQLQQHDHDLFDAGVQVEGEEHENEHDKHSPRIRRRRTTLLIGHGDFMSLVIKRIISGFGHFIETEGISHRSAAVHFNTGISEFEYFGHGRYLVMGTNHTPHIQPSRYSELRTGGSLKDGWSYIVPADKFVLGAEVSISFSDELESHVREQTDALRALYLSSSKAPALVASKSLDVEEEDQGGAKKGDLNFVVKRGLQVVGVATYSEATGKLSDVAILPEAVAGTHVGETLMNAVKKHARKLGRSESLIVHPRSAEGKVLFQKMGFSEIQDDDEKMESKI